MPSSTKATLTQAGFTVCIGNGKDDDELLCGYKHGSQPIIDQSDNIKAIKCCYMAAKPGEDFCIHIAYNHPRRRGSKTRNAGFRAYVFIDGICVTDEFWPAEKLNVGDRELEIVGYRGFDNSASRFCFKQRQSTDNDLSIQESQLSDSWLGTILVGVFWCNYHVIEDEDEDERDERFVEEQLNQMFCAEALGSPLHERKQGAEFDIGVEYAPRNAQPVDDDELIYYHTDKATKKGFEFIFHYRRPEWLLAKGIAPQSPLEPGDNPVQQSPTPTVKHEEECTNKLVPIVKPTSPPRTRSSTRTEMGRETSSLARGTRSPSQRQESETRSPKVERRASKRLAPREQSTMCPTKRVKRA
ncbi:hypothetical protein FRC12_010130 [Ceratobasidium sp. 428]|nr:hypothetical protein FRC09_007430 [Ceratobasidium sp. 395]KAG8757971.1 hypothetical protein FRC12_010130 [Ceratobasidium sp. 428]